MTRTLRYTTAALASLGLLSILACSGGGGSSPAPTPTSTTLQYTDPASGTYKLVKDASSTAAHLVLNLKGPGGALSGVGFALEADSTKVTWANLTGSAKVTNTAFTTPVVAGKVTGDELQGGIFQKGVGIPAITADADTVLATVALDLKAGVPLNSPVTFIATDAKCVILEGPGGGTPTTPITITVGSLVTQ